jgi:glyoxylase-like metal-dependent hydrolase (beta-lactamase superfamily II)
MNRLAPGIFYVDLGFLATPHVIATAVLHGRSGVALIDPGPSSTLHTLSERLEEAGIGIADITAVLLTHIHLDHAGATGTLIRRNPRIRVYVYERGVPHITNPDKLLASATRLYGHDMDRLWSEFLPVPPTAIVALAGGERSRAVARQPRTDRGVEAGEAIPDAFRSVVVSRRPSRRAP